MRDGRWGGGRGKLCLLNAAAEEGVDVSILEIGASAHLGLFALPLECSGYINHNDLIGRESGSGSKLQPSSREPWKVNSEPQRHDTMCCCCMPDLPGQADSTFHWSIIALK